MPTCCVPCMTTPQAKGALVECAGAATGNGDRLQLFTLPPTPGTNSVSEKVSPKASLRRKHQKTLKGLCKLATTNYGQKIVFLSCRSLVQPALCWALQLTCLSGESFQDIFRSGQGGVASTVRLTSGFFPLGSTPC